MDEGRDPTDSHATHHESQASPVQADVATPRIAPPDVLIIGHVTRDLLPDGETRLGGTALYAALAAQRLGQTVAIITSGPPDLLAELHDAAPGVAIAAAPSPVATTFAHEYTDGVRRLFLRARANPLGAADIPAAWRAAPLVLLAPLAGEVDPTLASSFPATSLVGATAQGWLRRWDHSGAVLPRLMDDHEMAALPDLDARILSDEDLRAPPRERIPRAVAKAEAQLRAWAGVTPLLVVTQGAAGAELWRTGAAPEHFPGYPAQVVDTTGAGDVFAAAFLIRLRETDDPRAAMDFANRVAARSVEGYGPNAIPTRDEASARFGSLR